jgi:hypothetical protein
VSAVSQILEAYGRQRAEAARERGRIWGQAIENIGQIPQQIQQQQLLKAREQRLNQQAASEQALTDLKLQDARDNRLDQTLTGQLVTGNTTTDENGHITTNHDAVYQGLLVKGRTKAAEAYLNFANAAETHANEVQARVLKTEADKQNWRAERMSSVIDAPPEQRPARYAVFRGTLSALAQSDPILKSLPPDYPGDEAFQQLYDSTRTHEARLKDSADAIEKKLKESTIAKNVAEAKKAEAEAAGGGTSEWGMFASSFAKSQGKGSWSELNPGQQQNAFTAFARAKADPAAERQARALQAQIDAENRRESFTEAQAGRKELTDKVETPYQTARASSNTLRDVVAAAQAGNKVAGSLQSLETTMAAIRAQGLNRINTAEIGVTANAGSLWDRLQGWVGKATEGQPVPADVQKDMLQFADILDKAAYQKYITGHRAITQRYGLKDEQPLPAPGVMTSTANAPDLTGLTPGHSRTFNTGPFAGQTWTLGSGGQPVKVR